MLMTISFSLPDGRKMMHKLMYNVACICMASKSEMGKAGTEFPKTNQAKSTPPDFLPAARCYNRIRQNVFVCREMKKRKICYIIDAERKTARPPANSSIYSYFFKSYHLFGKTRLSTIIIRRSGRVFSFPQKQKKQ